MVWHINNWNKVPPFIQANLSWLLLSVRREASQAREGRSDRWWAASTMQSNTSKHWDTFLMWSKTLSEVGRAYLINLFLVCLVYFHVGIVYSLGVRWLILGCILWWGVYTHPPIETPLSCSDNLSKSIIIQRRQKHRGEILQNQEEKYTPKKRNSPTKACFNLQTLVWFTVWSFHTTSACHHTKTVTRSLLHLNNKTRQWRWAQFPIVVQVIMLRCMPQHCRQWSVSVPSASTTFATWMLFGPVAPATVSCTCHVSTGGPLVRWLTGCRARRLSMMISPWAMNMMTMRMVMSMTITMLMNMVTQQLQQKTKTEMRICIVVMMMMMKSREKLHFHHRHHRHQLELFPGSVHCVWAYVTMSPCLSPPSAFVAVSSSRVSENWWVMPYCTVHPVAWKRVLAWKSVVTRVCTRVMLDRVQAVKRPSYSRATVVDSPLR